MMEKQIFEGRKLHTDDATLVRYKERSDRHHNVQRKPAVTNFATNNLGN